MTKTITRDGLQAVQERLAELRDKRAAAVRSLGAASTDPEKAAKWSAHIERLDEQIAGVTSRKMDLLRGVGGDDPGARVLAPEADWPLPGWDAANVLDDTTRAALAAYAASSARRGGSVPIGEIISREALAAAFGAGAMASAITSTDSMRRGTFIGVVPPLRRRLSILDLLPVSTMDGKSVPYTVESGSLTTATEVAEGAAKPEAAITLTDAEAVAATIAHWHKVQKQSLADAPALQATLENRLRYGVMLRLENEVLAGNGTAPNLRGILNTVGIAAVTYTAGALITDQILRGLTAVHNAEGSPNAIVLNPTDWATALITKAAGSGEYLGGTPFGAQIASMWGVPLIPSTAITQGTALVGDFAMGAQLFIREGVQVLFSDSDTDDFVHNIVTLLAEMRAALAVFRPLCFATVALQ